MWTKEGFQANKRLEDAAEEDVQPVRYLRNKVKKDGTVTSERNWYPGILVCEDDEVPGNMYVMGRSGKLYSIPKSDIKDRPMDDLKIYSARRYRF